MNRLSFSRTQILILLSVWLTFLLSFVMRLSWASVMPILNEALHFTAKMGAQHISAFYFGYALTVLPGGILADKIGYRRTILFSLIGMAAVTALMSTITDYNMAWGLRFLLGVMSGPVQASCLSAIGDHFGPNQRVIDLEGEPVIQAVAENVVETVDGSKLKTATGFEAAIKLEDVIGKY